MSRGHGLQSMMRVMIQTPANCLLTRRTSASKKYFLYFVFHSTTMVEYFHVFPNNPSGRCSASKIRHRNRGSVRVQQRSILNPEFNFDCVPWSMRFDSCRRFRLIIIFTRQVSETVLAGNAQARTSHHWPAFEWWGHACSDD
jgi:hypothetical protein